MIWSFHAKPMLKTPMLKPSTKPDFSLSSLTRLAIGVLGGGVLLLSSNPVMAQSTSADDFGSGDNPGLFDSGDGPSMFELMHRAQQGTIRNRYEFMQEQQQNILDEASDFRTRQQDALQQPNLAQPAAQPSEPATPSAQPEDAAN